MRAEDCVPVYAKRTGPVSAGVQAKPRAGEEGASSRCNERAMQSRSHADGYKVFVLRAARGGQVAPLCPHLLSAPFRLLLRHRSAAASLAAAGRGRRGWRGHDGGSGPLGRATSRRGCGSLSCHGASMKATRVAAPGPVAGRGKPASRRRPRHGVSGSTRAAGRGTEARESPAAREATFRGGAAAESCRRLLAEKLLVASRLRDSWPSGSQPHAVRRARTHRRGRAGWGKGREAEGLARDGRRRRFRCKAGKPRGARWGGAGGGVL